MSEAAQRRHVAYNAAAGVEALLETLNRERAAAPDSFDDVAPYLLRQIKALNSVVLSVLGDDHARSLTDMQAVVAVVDGEEALHE